MTESQTSMRPRLTVSLDAVQANYATLKQRANGADIACTVKADAYGLGVAAVAPALLDAGATSFFVTYGFEGAALRLLLGKDADIYVFNGASADDISLFSTFRLIPVLNTLAQCEFWQKQGDGKPCALHIDTAMNRLGLSMADADKISGMTALQKNLDVQLILSHLACGSNPQSPRNRQQAEDFSRLVTALKKPYPRAKVSLSASAGLFLDLPIAETLSRPGLALFGAGPMDEPESTLQPTVLLQAPVMQLRTIQPGETVGYGATFTAKRVTKVATLGIGYGDGYARYHADKSSVMIRGQACPLIGRVSMDLITVDITDLETLPLIGEMVEIFGGDIAIEVAAERVNTISYELLVTLGPRIERIYR